MVPAVRPLNTRTRLLVKPPKNPVLKSVINPAESPAAIVVAPLTANDILVVDAAPAYRNPLIDISAVVPVDNVTEIAVESFVSVVTNDVLDVEVFVSKEDDPTGVRQTHAEPLYIVLIPVGI